MHKDEVARMKNEQKEHHKIELDSKMNIPGRWNLPDDPDNEENLLDLWLITETCLIRIILIKDVIFSN